MNWQRNIRARFLTVVILGVLISGAAAQGTNCDNKEGCDWCNCGPFCYLGHCAPTPKQWCAQYFWDTWCSYCDRCTTPEPPDPEPNKPTDPKPQPPQKQDPVAQITVTPNPATDFDGDGQEKVTLDGSSSYDPDGGVIAKYEWSTGSTKPNYSNKFSVGTHEVGLMVTDDEGQTGTATASVTVKEKPKLVSDANRLEDGGKSDSNDTPANESQPGCQNPCGCAMEADPIYMRNAEFSMSFTDLSIRGRALAVEIVRSYGSKREHNSAFGYGWNMNYNMKLRRLKDDTSKVVLLNDAGCKIEYTKDTGNPDIYLHQKDYGDYVAYDANIGTFSLVEMGGLEYHFDSNGNLASVVDEKGNSRITFEYDLGGRLPIVGQSEYIVNENGVQTGERGIVAMAYKLTAITDDIGRQITLSYNSDGLLETVTDFGERIWQYYYDPVTNDLVAMEGPTGLVTTYQYENHNLVAIYDPCDNLLVRNWYDGDVVHEQEIGEGSYIFDYNEQTKTTIVTDREGYVTEIVYGDSGELLSRRVYTRDMQDSFITTYAYDDHLNKTLEILPAGNCIAYTYDDIGEVNGIYRKASPGEPNDPNDPDVIATLYIYDVNIEAKVSQIRDPMGNVTSYEYYLEEPNTGNIKTITYPKVTRADGDFIPVERYTYDVNGRLDTVTSPDGVVTKHIYYAANEPNGWGWPWKTIVDYNQANPNALNLTTEYKYDQYGNVKEEIDPNGNSAQYVNNALNQVIETTDPLGYKTKFSYDGNGRRQKVERQTSDVTIPWQETTFTYNVFGKVATVTDPCNYVTTYLYDKNGNLSSLIDVNNNTTGYAYNERGLLESITDANNGVTRYYYTDNGEVESVEDPNGGTIEYGHDSFDRVTTVTDSLGHYRVNTYDKLSRVTKETAYDKLNIPLMQKRTEYDSLGRVTRRAAMANPASAGAISFSVDMVIDYNYAHTFGNLMDETTYYGGGIAATTKYEYNRIGRRTRTIDPAGNETIVEYDNKGLITRVQQIENDPIGSNDINVTTDYTYDAGGRLFEEIRKPNINDADTWLTTRYQYDALGNRTQETRANGVVVKYNYDVTGRLTRMIADEGSGKINQTTTFGYDKFGRLKMITGYADGSTAQTTTYEYDRVGRTTRILYPDGNDIRFTYSPAGKVVTRTDQRVIVTHYDYDYAYNMLSKTATIGGVDYDETFTYDGLGRMRTAVKTQDSDPVSQTEFGYNGLGLIVDANESLFGGTLRNIRYGYDQRGAINSITYPNSSSVSVVPDWQGRIGTMTIGGTQVAAYDYIGSHTARRSYPVSGIDYTAAYDNLGRITSADFDDSYVKFDYGYTANTDDIAWQRYAHRTGDPCVAFSYDNLDRLTVAQYDLDINEVFTMDELGNRMAVKEKNGSSTTYDVNNLNNRYTSIGASALTYDKAGNLVKDKDGYGYEYDYENRITRVTKDQGQTTLAEFHYDALGRRIAKDVAGGAATLYYYNPNWQLLSEYDLDTGQHQRSYVYGNYIDEVLMMREAAGDDYCYLHDHLYSPAALVDENGDVVERYEYDAYGKPKIMSAGYVTRTSSAYGNSYLFTGRTVDFFDVGGSLKLQYNRNRYYDYPTGRWLTQDPAGYVDGANLYEYVAGNPIRLADPYGLWPWSTYGYEEAKSKSLKDAEWERYLYMHDFGYFGDRYRVSDFLCRNIDKCCQKNTCYETGVVNGCSTSYLEGERKRRSVFVRNLSQDYPLPDGLELEKRYRATVPNAQIGSPQVPITDLPTIPRNVEEEFILAAKRHWEKANVGNIDLPDDPRTNASIGQLILVTVETERIGLYHDYEHGSVAAKITCEFRKNYSCKYRSGGPERIVGYIPINKTFSGSRNRFESFVGEHREQYWTPEIFMFIVPTGSDTIIPLNELLY